MSDKTLRIIFSGISTLTPPPPRNGEKPDKAFVMMAANEHTTKGKRVKQINEWGTTIPDHFPFVHVATRLLIDPPMPPDETVFAGEGGEHFIYFFKDARVVIQPEPKPGTRIDYFIDTKHPLAERPGSDNVAPPDDIRWLADIRDLLSKPAPFKKTADPAQQYVGEEVAAVVDLHGGVLKANFPCATVSPKTFKDGKGNVVPGLQRVLADEFIIDIPYPEKTDRITLEFRQLRENTPVNEPKKLVMAWPEEETLLVVRMGNDTKGEIRRLDTPERCDPVRQTGPVLKPRDDDFDLHYNFLQIPKGVGRPLPQNDVRQCSVDGCKPGTI
jgi:hypothetical protein